MKIRGLISTPPAMRRHPLTGLPIEPVGVVGNKVIWPIMGGAPDPDDDDEEAKAEAERKAKEEADAKAEADKGKDDEDKSGSEDSAKQLEDALARMKAADKRADAAEAKIKDAERAKMDEVERLKADVADRDEKIKGLEAENSTLRLNTAFVTANKVKWHDPDTALGLAQSGGYLDGVIGEDGEINKKALGSALDRLGKDKPYLVKSKDGEDDKPGGPSGEPAGGRADNGKDDKAQKQALKRRFPVLNQR